MFLPICKAHMCWGESHMVPIHEFSVSGGFDVQDAAWALWATPSCWRFFFELKRSALSPLPPSRDSTLNCIEGFSVLLWSGWEMVCHMKATFCLFLQRKRGSPRPRNPWARQSQDRWQVTLGHTDSSLGWLKVVQAHGGAIKHVDTWTSKDVNENTLMKVMPRTPVPEWGMWFSPYCPWRCAFPTACGPQCLERGVLRVCVFTFSWRVNKCV